MTLKERCLEVYTRNDAYWDTATVARVEVNILGVKFSAYGDWDIDSTKNDVIHQACSKRFISSFNFTICM